MAMVSGHRPDLGRNRTPVRPWAAQVLGRILASWRSYSYRSSNINSNRSNNPSNSNINKNTHRNNTIITNSNSV